MYNKPMSNTYNLHQVGDIVITEKTPLLNKNAKIFFKCNVFTSIITFTFGIISIIIGIVSPGTCNVTDRMGLNVSQFLIGSGISSVCFVITILCLTYLIIYRRKLWIISIVLVLSILYVLFTLSWFIVGGIILFRSNVPCIQAKSPTVIFGLVIWCFQVFNFISGHSHSNISDQSRRY